MSLQRIKVSGFRCLDDLEIQPDSQLNLITGANASGKTSLLESIFYLGRGRSFRGSGNRELIQAGKSEFVLFGQTIEQDQDHLRWSPSHIAPRTLLPEASNKIHFTYSLHQVHPTSL